MKKASELASWGFIFRCEDYGLDTTIDMQARCIASFLSGAIRMTCRNRRTSFRRRTWDLR